jgi:aryl-alcohol dehydrogenase-like predicted oxidoreductase
MEYTTLGDTGMTVSRICLGCMSFGSSDWREWVLEEKESRPVIERAIDLGINFFDTANVYSHGESERVLGNALDEYDSDELVVATKVYNPASPDPHPNETGLSRKTIDQELTASLDRLGMETVDLYQTHRWDYETPIEETLRALDDTIRRNKVRYIGTSSQWAFQFANSLHTSDRLGLDRFVSMQNHYNLAYREEERETLPLCEREGIGIIPWSPLARGYLTRPHEEFLETTRGRYMNNSRLAERIDTYRANGGETINERVDELATEKDVTMAQIALAWLLHQESVDAPIIGTTSIEHLEDAVEALDISLSDSDLEYLQEPYEPVEINGHQ